MLSGDGVYSRYLGRFLEAGRYTFTIRVDDNDNNALYHKTIIHSQSSNGIDESLNNLKISKADNADLYYKMTSKRRCCGSSVLSSLNIGLSDTKMEPVGFFKRSIIGPVIHITHPSKVSDDKIPPSRIGDLKIRQLKGATTSDRLIAEWTAPGGDFDVGSVASYRFVFSSHIQDLLQPNFGHPEVLLGFDRIERAGTSSKFDFNFPHYDKDYYVGIYAFDIAGNQGKISNLVHVRINAPKYENSKDSRPIIARSEIEEEDDWIVIGSICGIISVLLLLALSSIIYYIVMARKRSSVKVGSTSSVMGGTGLDETDSSSFDSDIKNIMSSNPSPRQNYSTTSSSQPITTPAETNSTTVTPVYWSASQLLSKLDQKNSHLNQSDQRNYYLNQQQHGGPPSLQNEGHAVLNSSENGYASNDIDTQAVSLHYHPTWSYQIPEEYTITVGGTYDVSQCIPQHSTDNYNLPPNVMPKPRNITQV